MFLTEGYKLCFVFPFVARFYVVLNEVGHTVWDKVDVILLWYELWLFIQAVLTSRPNYQQRFLRSSGVSGLTKSDGPPSGDPDRVDQCLFIHPWSWPKPRPLPMRGVTSNSSFAFKATGTETAHWRLKQRGYMGMPRHMCESRPITFSPQDKKS